MFYSIKNRLDKGLRSFLTTLERKYTLASISPLLSKSIKDFVLRKGKRIRPILFTAGYLGFCKKPKPGLNQSALSIELLHDFMLIHDDIIDKSDTRRGKPSMHVLLNRHLKNRKGIKFNGQDLSIVVGDVIYAMAIEAFLSIQEEPRRKEKALRRFIQAAVFTGAGEFIELINGAKKLEKLTLEKIYKIYDYKTSYYTFATPLASGAILAGAPDREVERLSEFGMLLGRAFQIKDDILGMFGDEKKIGKSTLTDLQEGKKTYIIWHAFSRAKAAEKRYLKSVLTKKKVTRKDLLRVQTIARASGTLDSAAQKIQQLVNQADKLLRSSSMRPHYRKMLSTYSQKLLSA
ncbi:polyprenyl synthetase family protein [Candidatus Omnitrophota bacterium]